MKSIALVKSEATETHESSISDQDIRVMISMIDYLITEISRIDPVSANHLQSARGTLADSVMPAAYPRAH